MASLRRGALPSSEAIVAEAFQELGYDQTRLQPPFVRQNFNSLLHTVWLKTLEVLERYEESVYAEGIPSELIRLKSEEVAEAQRIARDSGFSESLKFIFKKFYPYLRQAFLSITNSRMTRGGKDFELQFGRLLQLMAVPYRRVQLEDRVDFMLPSDDMFQRNPTVSVIASAKRTLRERWREVVEELYRMRCPNTFLITADKSITDGHIREICRRYRIHLVVWDEVKDGKFPNEPLVLGYTQWANERLPALEQRW